MKIFMPFRDRGLQFKLTMVMLILFACSLGSVFIPYLWGRETLRRELENSFLELSNAISVSVDQMTAPGDSDQDRLHRYVESLKKTGRAGIRPSTVWRYASAN